MVDCSHPVGSRINVRTINALLNNLPPALHLHRFVVDFTYAQYDSRQAILNSVAAMGAIVRDPPDCLYHLEICVSDWDETASWWRAEIVSLFSVAVRERGLLQVVVTRPHAEREFKVLSRRLNRIPG